MSRSPLVSSVPGSAGSPLAALVVCAAFVTACQEPADQVRAVAERGDYRRVLALALEEPGAGNPAWD
jgi:hypothetical protein